MFLFCADFDSGRGRIARPASGTFKLQRHLRPGLRRFE